MRRYLPILLVLWALLMAPSAMAAPERGALMINSNAWAGVDPGAASLLLDFAVFNGPSAPERVAFEAADSTSESFAYQDWGLACDTGNCAFTRAEARSAGWLGRYNKREAGPSSYPNALGIDQGKAGYGTAYAQKVVAKMQANDPRVGGLGWEGPFFDDVNVAHPAMPRQGVPDRYANSSIYKDAIKAQLIVARDYLWARGYETQGNIGGITEWEAAYQPADDLIGILDYSLIEHCGDWSSGGVQYEQPWARMMTAGRTAATRGEVLWCHTHQAANALFNDYWTRIITDPRNGAGSVDGGTYGGPIVWDSRFRNEYGTPTTTPQRWGQHAARSFSGGLSLHVDLSVLSAWTTTP